MFFYSRNFTGSEGGVLNSLISNCFQKNCTFRAKTVQLRVTSMMEKGGEMLSTQAFQLDSKNVHVENLPQKGKTEAKNQGQNVKKM